MGILRVGIERIAPKTYNSVIATDKDAKSSLPVSLFQFIENLHTEEGRHLKWSFETILFNLNNFALLYCDSLPSPNVFGLIATSFAFINNPISTHTCCKRELVLG
ncbi:hypothetical protein XU18_0075 [Perkinsela sp. CCAP 1560/4]|nr:hypothetical protein XU18_0075 [Perkinsela sp. CCAP 1560/4]|eukprot:KNH09390.1 hypothetical protein XU18_0075 [Perkinsela sp. CCAP 1560/4]